MDDQEPIDHQETTGLQPLKDVILRVLEYQLEKADEKGQRGRSVSLNFAINTILRGNIQEP